MQELPLERAFMLIEPGPVVLVTVADGRKRNVMTISWHMVLDFTPRFALKTGDWNWSFAMLMKTRECVLAIPTVDLSRKVVEVGSCSGADIDKFARFGLTPVKGKSVKAPLIAECLANIECRVVDYVEEHGIVVLDGVRAWIDAERKERRMFHAIGDGTFAVDGRTIDHRKIMEAKLPPGV